ncbi:glycosyltransferase family 4 protein [Pedobacter sp. SD-b]|uniref:Glycosyltransferase family 4 protein n=1 Tax=Pedobacter segetis TaxID=2793069 RepID=A0ABS1BHK5_9SPHI|nr:glycosyltransferase family 4 protein [Pedobacter segetis]MBK0382251.1 glycosyltransferase family 4 protein [Pedobacter segetis]
MKVCLINTADHGGGAPVACKRLLQALKPKVDVDLLVQNKRSEDLQIFSTIHNQMGLLKAELNFYLERLPFIAFQEADKTVRFAFSTANTGTDISQNKHIQLAQILHFHWINQGFLSLKNIKSLLGLNKPVVWTLHDMWTFTGGCHYAGVCDHFLNECGNCQFLRTPQEHDISRKGWLKKKEIYKQNRNLVFVACSQWLANVAKSSSLLKNFRVIAIPNPIKTAIYKPLNQASLRKKWNIETEKKIILFGAANINDKRKGLVYLMEALSILKEKNPAANIQFLLFGKNKTLSVNQFPFPAKSFSIINNEQQLVEIYNLADVFVLPSLEDNLPNMVMEALSCAIPVVAFDQGGIPEMIDHQKNGYIAKYRSSEDLANGIGWVLDHPNDDLKNNAREKVLNSYSEEIVAEKYLALYRSLTSS